MKRWKVLGIACLAVSHMAMAQPSAKEVFVNMPDDMLPYLNATLRTELVEMAERGIIAEVTNKLEQTTSLDTLTVHSARLSTSKASTMQIELLNSAAEQPIVAVVKTWEAPEKESEVKFYSCDWKPLDSASFLPVLHLDDFLQKPDTMSQERFRQLSRLVDPFMVQAEIHRQGAECVMSLQLALPMVSAKERQQLAPIVRTRSLRWNGKAFSL